MRSAKYVYGSSSILTSDNMSGMSSAGSRYGNGHEGQAPAAMLRISNPGWNVLTAMENGRNRGLASPMVDQNEASPPLPQNLVPANTPQKHHYTPYSGAYRNIFQKLLLLPSKEDHARTPQLSSTIPTMTHNHGRHSFLSCLKSPLSS